jgi:hypothetical protein
MRKQKCQYNGTKVGQSFGLKTQANKRWDINNSNKPAIGYNF